MEEETTRKEMFKKEMLRAKKDLAETNERIKEAADDETKKWSSLEQTESSFTKVSDDLIQVLTLYLD